MAKVSNLAVALLLVWLQNGDRTIASRAGRSHGNCDPGTETVRWASLDHVSQSTNDKQLSLIMPTLLDDWARVSMLLASLHTFMDQSMVHAFYWIVPTVDQLVLHQLAPVGFVFPHVVILEEDLLDTAYGQKFNNTHFFAGGYKTQMIVKLLIARLLVTEYYLVLDADIISVRAFGLDQLFVGGKATYPYNSPHQHKQWYNASAKLAHISLEGKCKSAISNRFGPTPTILSTTLAKTTIEHLQTVHGADWLTMTMQADHLGWTEFALYHLVGCHSSLFDDYHEVGTLQFFEFFGDTTFDVGKLFDASSNILFAVLQDAVDGMTVRNVLKHLFAVLCPADSVTDG
ncbi:TPA: hypothetical protein ACH3X3_005147 [Trebouxia sp. C0006]